MYLLKNIQTKKKEKQHQGAIRMFNIYNRNNGTEHDDNLVRKLDAKNPFYWSMDDKSVDISQKIANSSDFNYFPRNVSKPVEASSAILVSNPIAESGYPTFVYEIPENITEQTSTDKAIELFGLMYDIVKNN